MDGKTVLPEMDDNVNKVVKNFMFTPTDISDFWKIFSKMDKVKTGLVPLVDIFKRVEMERNLITDCLLELLEIEHGQSSAPLLLCPSVPLSLCSVRAQLPLLSPHHTTPLLIRTILHPASYPLPHTSHITHHTPHITPHTPHITPHTPQTER